MAKTIENTLDHFTAHITINKVVKLVEKDSYDNSRRTLDRDSTELINLTLRAETLEALKVKIVAATELA